MSYLDTLNTPQREAVLQTEGPVMIIAGAGSGKTRVLTYRIAYLLEKGVDPYNILSLTFTNKAAREMRERIEDVVGPQAKSLWMGTFHSIFARILRYEANKIGYPSNFTIYDMDDAKSLIRSIVKELNIDDKIYKPNVVLGRISMSKNNLVSHQVYNTNPAYKLDDESAQRPEIGRIYRIYQERLFRAQAMDFDDLLFNTNVLFKDHLDVLNKYQHMFKYVMVDEFQDTNISQYNITKKLAALNRNICVVGDDAQSIYAFRGADIQNILNFEKDYSELKVVRLEQNYRSTDTIVQAANSVIAQNTAQLKKSVWTSNPEGTKIDLLVAASDNEEGKIVANSIFEKKNQRQLKNKDFAILYRTNSQSRSLEEALRRININYKIYGGLSFYQRKEIKDLMAYLRFTVNSNDEEALKRIINYPKRGVGDTSIAKIIVWANENNTSYWQALLNSPSYLTGRAAAAIGSFVTLVKSFKAIMETHDAFDTATHIAKKSGILKELYTDKSIEGLTRHENVQELLNGIKEYVDNIENEDKSMSAFLQEVSLLTDPDKNNQDDDDFVTLMTIHSSKGLEFKNVYLVGLEEDLFPSQMMLGSRADLEEERRLFYVAITRAESDLTISYAVSRYRFGRIKSCEPSRFLKDIDPRFLNQITKARPTRDAYASNEGFAGNYSNLIKNYQNHNKKPKFEVKSSPTQSSVRENFVPSDISNLKEGMTVEHPKFGMGTVKLVDASGASKKAIVHFQKFGNKTLLLSFAKLKIHS